MSGTCFQELEGTFLFHYLHMPSLFQDTENEQLQVKPYDKTNANKIHRGKMY